MKKLAFVAAACAVAFGFTSMASAALVGSFVRVDGESSTTPPAGFVTQDLMVNTDSDWTQAEIRVVLTSGSVYRDSFGAPDGSQPNPLFFGAAPTLRYDTYWKGWQPLGGGAEGNGSAGGAVDIGGTIAGSWNTAGLDKAWNNTATTDIGQSPTGIGRFTLSSTANGTFSLRLYNSQGFSDLTGQVANGVINPVPEPGTLVLAGLSIPALAFAIRRRRQVA